MNEFLDKLLKEAISLRDKRGKKLKLGEGICSQLIEQSDWDGDEDTCICRVVRFFAGQQGIHYRMYMPNPGVWTPERKKVMKAMIEGLQDVKIRQTVLQMLDGDL
jgi:hypothetical protein